MTPVLVFSGTLLPSRVDFIIITYRFPALLFGAKCVFFSVSWSKAADILKWTKKFLI